MSRKDLGLGKLETRVSTKEFEEPPKEVMTSNKDLKSSISAVNRTSQVFTDVEPAFPILTASKKALEVAKATKPEKLDKPPINVQPHRKVEEKTHHKRLDTEEPDIPKIKLYP